MPENPQIVAKAGVQRLAEIEDPLARAVLKLHEAVFTDYREVYCYGCDMGCSCEAASWPCQTVYLIAERFGIDLPPKYAAKWYSIKSEEGTQE